MGKLDAFVVADVKYDVDAVGHPTKEPLAVPSIVPGNDCESKTVYVVESSLLYDNLSFAPRNSQILIFCTWEMKSFA